MNKQHYWLVAFNLQDSYGNIRWGNCTTETSCNFFSFKTHRKVISDINKLCPLDTITLTSVSYLGEMTKEEALGE